ncbi:MAG: FkbM family methyltransferase [Dysgonamonadaceae bacterium]|jgi:hypothetical protein|nr:FkbM family methyltransferase [Dysgonamonadaceae bacterium]
MEKMNPFTGIKNRIRTNAILLGDLLRSTLLNSPRYHDASRLEPYGFKVYSQNDEDGIIQEIFNRIGITSKTFVEFGVGDGLENNTAYLLMQGWKGYWIESDSALAARIKDTYKRAINRSQLSIDKSFVTKNNINSLISKYFTGEIDLLSIDIDGNDYHVWKSIECINPRVVVIEYNAKFPPPCSVIMEYDENYCWDWSDKMGVSLQAVTDLGESLGYQLVGTNLNGVNAFFVRKDIILQKEKNLFPLPATAENLYNPARYYLIFSNGFPAKHFLG